MITRPRPEAAPTRHRLSSMRVYLGSDHAGYELKNHLVEWLKAAGHEPVDCGPHIYDAQDDYPPFCLRAAERPPPDPDALGIVIGGSGNGEQIAANKVKGVRCRAGLERGDRGARPASTTTPTSSAVGAPDAHARRRRRSSSRSSSAPRSPVSERHNRRIDMLSAYETTGELPPDPGAPPAAGLTPHARGAHDPPAGPDYCERSAAGPCAPSSPQGKFSDGAALLDGQVMAGAEAHGKHLFLGFGEPAGSTSTWACSARSPSARARARRPRTRSACGSSRRRRDGVRGSARAHHLRADHRRARSRRYTTGSARTRCAPDADPGSAWPRISRSRTTHRRPAAWTRRSSRASATSTAPRSSSGTASTRTAPARDITPRRVGRDLGGPGRADARGRTQQPHRHRPPRAHPGGDGPPAARRRPRRRGLRLPAGRACPATSAAARSAPPISPPATSSGARPASLPDRDAAGLSAAAAVCSEAVRQPGRHVRAEGRATPPPAPPAAAPAPAPPPPARAATCRRDTPRPTPVRTAPDRPRPRSARTTRPCRRPVSRQRPAFQGQKASSTSNTTSTGAGVRPRLQRRPHVHQPYEQRVPHTAACTAARRHQQCSQRIVHGAVARPTSVGIRSMSKRKRHSARVRRRVQRLQIAQQHAALGHAVVVPVRS